MNNDELHARRILVTRTEPSAWTLVKMIEEKGGSPILFPFFKLSPASDKSALLRVIECLDKYDIVVFVSPAAVEFGLTEILSHRAWPTKTQAAVVGNDTANLLKKNGIGQIIMPMDNFCSEGLLAHSALQPEKVRGKRILVMRAGSGRELLVRTLRGRGASVDLVACYQRQEVEDQALWLLMQNTPVDALTLFSTGGLYKMQRLAQAGLLLSNGKNLFNLPLFTPHRRVAEKAQHSGWRHIKITAMGESAMIEDLCGFDWSDNE